jgi:Zn finger protein HypA/HybF involved in hydrogenase expression
MTSSETITPSQMAMYRICEKCKGHTIPVSKDGRFYTYKNTAILIPKDFAIARCIDCNEEFFTEKEMVNLMDCLEAEYSEHEELIKAILEVGASEDKSTQS